MKPLGLLSLCSRFSHRKITFINCLSRSESEKDRCGRGRFPSEIIEKPEMYRHIRRQYKRYGITLEDFRRRLEGINPDLVLVGSMMTYWYEGVFTAIREIRRKYPRVPIILGGVYATLCTEHARRFSGADYVFPGEPSEDFFETVRELTGITALAGEDGFFDHPLPDYRLLEASASAPVLTSRGCPFRCSYCASAILQPGFSRPDPIRLARLLKPMLGRYRHIAFYDDALLPDYEEHLKKFLGELDGLGLRYHTPNALHAKYLTQSVALHMRRSGFQTVRLGFEFSGPRRQRETGGKVTTEEAEKAVERLLKAGFPPQQIGLYILCGTPGLEAGEIEQALRTVAGWGVCSMLVEFSPIPGTALWKDFPGSGTPSAQDPLFHNNTYHIHRGTVLSLSEYETLKRLSLERNRAAAAAKGFGPA